VPRNLQQLGDLLKRERERAGWTVRQLAEAAELVPSTVSRLETGFIASPRPGASATVSPGRGWKPLLTAMLFERVQTCGTNGFRNQVNGSDGIITNIPHSLCASNRPAMTPIKQPLPADPRPLRTKAFIVFAIKFDL